MPVMEGILADYTNMYFRIWRESVVFALVCFIAGVIFGKAGF